MRYLTIFSSNIFKTCYVFYPYSSCQFGLDIQLGLMSAILACAARVVYLSEGWKSAHYHCIQCHPETWARGTTSLGSMLQSVLLWTSSLCASQHTEANRRTGVYAGLKSVLLLLDYSQSTRDLRILCPLIPCLQVMTVLLKVEMTSVWAPMNPKDAHLLGVQMELGLGI